MKLTKPILFLFLLINFLAIPLSWSQAGPVARVIPIEGTLEYKKGDNDWAAVNRPKYLFENYSVRTTRDGLARLLTLQENSSAVLQNDSEIAIQQSAIVVVRGELGEAEDESGSLLSSLANKFINAQRFTTVRRQGPCEEVVRTARDISLSTEYPELVWKNACPTYSYRLIIGDLSFDIPPAGEANMVRYRLTGLEENKEYSYKIEVLQKGRVLYTPRNSNTLRWLSDEALDEIRMANASPQDDVFMFADLLESQNLLVPAMDLYRQFFDNNTEDNDMRPLLILAYANLGLANLQSDESRFYNRLRGQ